MKSEAESEYVDFVTHHANGLCNTAYLLCGDWKRAEDATQEALLKLYRSWPRLRRQGAIGAYARKVVVSTTLDSLRRRSSTELVGGETYFSSTADPADPLGLLENRLLIIKALGCSGGTVKSQTLRALEKLRLDPALADLTDFAGLGG
ncbi:sigma factor [Kribbella sp. NPDC051718]|uniref:sigma factor n=1 Tax=Kribbella sp. NPDC051718 TaxID=3155168 RepID=UPI0034492833